jgi:DNA ligase (NAD+)
MNKTEKLKQIINQLNQYRDEYYNKENPSVSDQEYDKLFDELVELEKETGIYMNNSPTQTVGYEVKSKLDKIIHSHPMQSLDKTKSINDLKMFANNKDCLLSLKMDGLTVLLTYDNGELIQAETRGNGEEGELITHNAKMFENIPLHIGYKERLEIEGEAIITYDDFEKINSEIPVSEKYKNPRNLVSGSVRQLDNRVAAERHVKFIAWKVPYIIKTKKTMIDRFDLVEELGFEVVPNILINNHDIDYEKHISKLKHIAEEKKYPIDGLVMTYNDIAYGESLGITGHHPKHSLAFKFYDEEVNTILREIDWTIGKTGSLTPTAVFDSVEIDGTEVSRASLHNISICRKLQLGIGDAISVYKANLIIPQVKENLTRSNNFIIPKTCPICGGSTEIVKDKETEVLMCANDDCQGKFLGKLSHFASKNAINIEGLSEATLQFLIDKGWIKSLKDIYTLDWHWDEWTKEPGFGEKSVLKLLENIANSKNTTLERFLYAQSIPLIGRSASKDISKMCSGSIDTFCEIMSTGTANKFLEIDGFGETMLKSLEKWFDVHWIEFLELKEEFNFETVKSNQNNTQTDLLSGKTFVITGSLEHFKNREELAERILSLGGKVSGSVSAKTSFLINNDIHSTSGKNAKAKSLGVAIVSESDFLKMIGE